MWINRGFWSSLYFWLQCYIFFMTLAFDAWMNDTGWAYWHCHLKWRPLGLMSAQLLARVVSEVFSSLFKYYFIISLFILHILSRWLLLYSLLRKNRVHYSSALHCLGITLLYAAKSHITALSPNCWKLSAPVSSILHSKLQQCTPKLQ